MALPLVGGGYFQTAVLVADRSEEWLRDILAMSVINIIQNSRSEAQLKAIRFNNHNTLQL